MTLFTRLLLSHLAPLAIVAVSLALVLAALFHISVVLTTLSESELNTLQDEGSLHKEAWELDVALRHSQLSCAQDESLAEAEIRPILFGRIEALKAAQKLLGVSAPLRSVVESYLALGAEVLTGETCRTLLAESTQTRRADLDEQLTNFWVARLEELHRAVREKDGEARRIAVLATWVGIPLAFASFMLSVLVAQRMATAVKEPLERFSELASRIGRGDFGRPVHVQGPLEVVVLAEHLERMRKQLAQLEALKQGFLASVSHELRTPLSKIREALALLQDGAVGALEDRQARVVQIARIACEREIRMVTTLLDLSRLRAGSPIRLRERCAIDGVLQGAIQDERADASALGIAIDLEAPGEGCLCRMDPVLLERAFANLFRNAVSVSKRGDRVRVQRTLVQDKAGRSGTWICVAVIDQGPGVPEAIREQIFEAFVTESVPTSNRAVGVGIGLALAREVARAHGGDLTLSASSPSGATFELWLPQNANIVEPPLGSPRSLGIEPVTG